MPVVLDLSDQKEAEDKQVAAAPRVPAAVILGEQAPHWLPLRALEWGPTMAQTPRRGSNMTQLRSGRWCSGVVGQDWYG